MGREYFGEPMHKNMENYIGVGLMGLPHCFQQHRVNMISEERACASSRGAEFMGELTAWQQKFVEILRRCNEVKKIILFNQLGSEKVRVLIANPTEDSAKVIPLYTRFLKKNSGLYFDFLIFGEEEFELESLPDSAILIDCEG